MGKVKGAVAWLGALLALGCASTTPGAPASAGGDAAEWLDAVPDNASAAHPNAADANAADASADTAAEITPDTQLDGSGDASKDAAPDVSADSGSAAAADQWCAAWAAATCALWTKCPLVVGGQTTAQCEKALQKECLGSAALTQSLASGKLKFDEAKAAQCLADLKKTDCPALYQTMISQPGAAVPSCGQVLVGQQPAGAACQLATECLPGAHCVFGANCPGKCQAWSKVGQVCTADKPCEPGVAACSGGVCLALSSAVGGKCVDYQCSLPLYCDVATGNCAKFGLTDSPCTAAGQLCWAGLTCFAPTGQAGTCKPLAGKGAACLSHGNCSPLGPEGALLCIGGSCQQGPSPGAPCFDWQCSGGWCDAAALPPTCKAWPAPGSPCAMGALCGPGAFCSAGTCKVLAGPGQPCVTATDCLSGACGGGKCAAAGTGPCG